MKANHDLFQPEGAAALDACCVAGVDEVGRGPLAGPVVAAAVVLDSSRPIEGLADSKKLTAKQRQFIANAIRSRALAWSVARAEVEEIDAINILQASLRAMARAVRALNMQLELVLVDGNKAPALSIPTRTIVKGDQLIPAISAASILAKVARDREMERMANRYPGYGFEGHKGYPTKAHMSALDKLGVCPIHRRSFGPVQKILLRDE